MNEEVYHKEELGEEKKREEAEKRVRDGDWKTKATDEGR